MRDIKVVRPRKYFDSATLVGVEADAIYALLGVMNKDKILQLGLDNVTADILYDIYLDLHRETEGD